MTSRQVRTIAPPPKRCGPFGEDDAILLRKMPLDDENPDRPRWARQLTPTTHAVVGTNISLWASVTGGDLRVAWMHNGAAITASRFREAPMPNSSVVLHLTNISLADAGTYIVLVSNGHGHITTQTEVIVTQKKREQSREHEERREPTEQREPIFSAAT